MSGNERYEISSIQNLSAQNTSLCASHCCARCLVRTLQKRLPLQPQNARLKAAQPTNRTWTRKGMYKLEYMALI